MKLELAPRYLVFLATKCSPPLVRPAVIYLPLLGAALAAELRCRPLLPGFPHCVESLEGDRKQHHQRTQSHYAWVDIGEWISLQFVSSQAKGAGGGEWRRGPPTHTVFKDNQGSTIASHRSLCPPSYQAHIIDTREIRTRQSPVAEPAFKVPSRLAVSERKPDIGTGNTSSTPSLFT